MALEPLPPLATVADVEAISGAPVANTDRVERLLAMASAAVRTYCHQSLSLVTFDEVMLPSEGTGLLTLAELPVRDVHQILLGTRWGLWWMGGSFEARARGIPIEDFWGDYTWDAAGRLRRLDGFAWGERYDPVWVTYTHGYDPVPDEIVGLVATKVHAFMTGTAANPEGLRSLTLGDYTRTWANGSGSGLTISDPTDKAILDHYRAAAVAVPIGGQ